jgi:cytochrome c biogenesis protein CcmG/thiol:disulfide interchange protein DsbE
MRRPTRLVGLLLPLMATALVIAGCDQREGGPAVKKPAPDFNFTALDGSRISLADLAARPVVLNFWASWCPACAMTAPNLQAIYEKYGGQGLLVVGVAGEDSEEDISKKAKELGITYPVAISHKTAIDYRVRAIPATFFIDRDGQLISSLVGAREPAEFEAEVQKIL